MCSVHFAERDSAERLRRLYLHATGDYCFALRESSRVCERLLAMESPAFALFCRRFVTQFSGRTPGFGSFSLPQSLCNNVDF
jgi:hypothetical protein